MRSFPLILLAAAALLAPAQALATTPAPPTSATTARFFVINGLVLGRQSVKTSGKISIEGRQLVASVGCNTIGGKVEVAGDVVTISGPLAMTAMGCPGSVGDTEAMFVVVLQHGPFQITDRAWVGDGAQILADELANMGPGPNASNPPDEPVGSSPGAVIVEPWMSCAPGAIGGSTSGGGSSGGGGGSSGSGIGSTGEAEGPAGTAIAEPAGTAEAEPPATPPMVVPDPGTVVGPGKPAASGAPIDLDPCAERMNASDTTTGDAGAGAVPPEGIAAAAAERASEQATAAATLAPIGTAVLVIVGLGALAVRRWRATRP